MLKVVQTVHAGARRHKAKGPHSAPGPAAEDKIRSIEARVGEIAVPDGLAEPAWPGFNLRAMEHRNRPSTRFANGKPGQSRPIRHHLII